MAAELEEAVGTVCWWGLSPAIDLRLHLPPEPDPAAEASVLLLGAAEGRHLLLTAARARRGPPRSITVRTGTGSGGSCLYRVRYHRSSPGASLSSSWPSRAPSPWRGSCCSCCWLWSARSGPDPQPVPPLSWSCWAPGRCGPARPSCCAEPRGGCAAGSAPSGTGSRTGTRAGPPSWGS